MTTEAAPGILAEIDEIRRDATDALDQAQRAELGQFMTPLSVARLMASMLRVPRDDVRLLDAGAGYGSLTAAAVSELLARPNAPMRIHVMAYEVEPRLTEYLGRTLELCAAACDLAGVEFGAHVETTDFLADAVRRFCWGERPVNCAILNPPYRKINAGSDAREACRVLGFEASNLYAAFVGGAVQLMEDGGEIVSITPRSFANGPYFRAFRAFLLGRLSFSRLHVFDSRTRTFQDDDVLQENLIVAATRTDEAATSVEITASAGPGEPVRARSVPWNRVVYPRDPERFIHLIDTDEGDAVAERIRSLDTYLPDLGLSVSTGPVVDFRATNFLRVEPDVGTVPLIYPKHLAGGGILWPRASAKWNALVLAEETLPLTVARGTYVLTKRFTAKEEQRRVVACVLGADAIDTDRIGLENHLNYFHENGAGLPLELARGLAAYLNSTLVDTYFRQFSGHTQVNAADLRNIPYPPRKQLERLGEASSATAPDQAALDVLVDEILFDDS